MTPGVLGGTLPLIIKQHPKLEKHLEISDKQLNPENIPENVIKFH